MRTPTYTYNLAQQLTQVDLPDGRSVVYGYDSAGRLASRTIARGAITQTYDLLTGELSGITAPGSEGLSFTYQGDHLSGQTWTGTISASTTQSRGHRRPTRHRDRRWRQSGDLDLR